MILEHHQAWIYTSPAAASESLAVDEANRSPCPRDEAMHGAVM